MGCIISTAAYADDCVGAIILFSLRESEQVRKTAQAVVYASLQKPMKADLIKICESTRKSMETLTLPVMKNAAALGGHDPQHVAVLRKLASLQELAYQEIEAAQAVLESDDMRSAVVAFGKVDDKMDVLFREVALSIHQLSVR
jgi:hypothetical protein